MDDVDENENEKIKTMGIFNDRHYMKGILELNLLTNIRLLGQTV